MHVLQAGGLSSRVEGAVQEAKKRDMDDLHQDGETRAPGMWIACIAALTSRNKCTLTPTDTHTETLTHTYLASLSLDDLSSHQAV